MVRMLDVREKTKLRRIIYAKPTILAIFILVALLIHGVWGIYQKRGDAIAKRDKSEMELAKLKNREIELSPVYDDTTNISASSALPVD